MGASTRTSLRGGAYGARSPTNPLYVPRTFQGGASKARESMAWRCDMHPAWDRDFRWLAFNGRPGGKRRQVLISYLGDPARLGELVA